MVEQLHSTRSEKNPSIIYSLIRAGSSLVVFEEGRTRNDYALLVAILLVFAMAMLFIMGPQVALIYAEAEGAALY
ncbi:MAG: hypothetical protein AAF702_16455 [Chloroflexota bacterium]